MKTTTIEIIDAIKGADKVLVCGHIRPDGDCVGSALAMRKICEKLGKEADAVCDAEKPSYFAFLPSADEFCNRRFDYYDLFIAVDCAEEKRLGVYKDDMLAAKKVINIDHHPTNPSYGDINFVVKDASSVCEVIFDLFEHTDLIDTDIATCLFTGLSTDTGHFVHDNTDSHVFDIASKLCSFNVNIADITRKLYGSKSFQKTKLTARAIDGITMHAGGKIALMVITKSDLEDYGCKSEDTEGLIDYATSISGVLISIAMCEMPDKQNLYRVSLRSVDADVSLVAAGFGGGGHKKAAGCIISGDKDEVAKKIVAAASAALEE